MGEILSKPNPNNSFSSSPPPTSTTTTTTTTMPSSNLSQTHYSTPQTDPTHQPKSEESSDPPLKETTENSTQNDNVLEGEDINEKVVVEEEEEGECGFCLFMKGGGCREEFIEWEKCVEEGEKNKEDIVDKCFEVTRALKDCMLAHSDYYGPILRAEEAAEAEAVKELEKEKEKNGEEDREEGEGGNRELGSVSESVATIEVERGENLDGGVQKEAS